MAVRTNQKLIVNLLQEVILLGNQMLNEELQRHLVEAYMTLEKQLEIQSKPVLYLLGKYGINVDELLEQRKLEEPNLLNTQA